MNSLAPLGSTWLIDMDGTLSVHNAYLNNSDSLLPGVKELWGRFLPQDQIIILTARDEIYRSTTENFLIKNELRYDLLLMGLPKGARILINDKKPDGTETAFCLNIVRNHGPISAISLMEKIL